MVELLDPGTEVETCLMAGRSMNGLRGVIVRRDPDNGRYTLELEDGEMMSVRIRNVRKIREPGEDGDGGGWPKSDGDGARWDDGGKNSSPPSFPSSAPTAPGGGDEGDNDDGRDVPRVRNPQRETDSIFGAVSPANAILAALAAYFYLKSENGDGVRINLPYDEMSSAMAITLAVFSYLAWEWGTKPLRRRPRGEFRLSNLSERLSRCDFWELLLLSLLAMWSLEVPMHLMTGVGTFVFFVWKFGTNNGRAPFGWDNVKARMAGLNVWEALMLARALQGGLGALNQVGRRRPRGRRRFRGR